MRCCIIRKYADNNKCKEAIRSRELARMKELQKNVDGIRDEIKAIYEADYTDEERETMEENGQAYDLYSYFADVLDMEYTVDCFGEYKGANIYVTLGGPNVWIDTRDGYVKGAWGSDKAESPIPYDICDEIDDIFREYYRATRR